MTNAFNKCHFEIMLIKKYSEVWGGFLVKDDASSMPLLLICEIISEVLPWKGITICHTSNQ